MFSLFANSKLQLYCYTCVVHTDRWSSDTFDTGIHSSFPLSLGWSGVLSGPVLSPCTVQCLTFSVQLTTGARAVLTGHDNVLGHGHSVVSQLAGHSAPVTRQMYIIYATTLTALIRYELNITTVLTFHWDTIVIPAAARRWLFAVATECCVCNTPWTSFSRMCGTLPPVPFP